MFETEDLAAWLGARRKECLAAVGQIPITDVVASPLESLTEPLLDRYRVSPLVLDRGGQFIDEQSETPVWGSGGLVTQRVRVNTGTTSPGYHTTVHVPYKGLPILLTVRPPGVRPGARPRGWAVADPDELQFRFEWVRGQPPLIETTVSSALDDIDEFLDAQRPLLEEFNADLERLATAELVARRSGFLEASAQLDRLKIPVYRRADSPVTFAAPGITRRPAPKATAIRAEEPPEPTLVAEFYTHIVRVLAAMARGMERTPGDYSGWSEEQLRDALLVILNTHYNGQAMGEAFNKSGKTDILVRVADRNVFIGECKWWSGPKAFASPEAERSALDQLLSYATWRDAKLALAVFVPNQDITGTIATAKKVLSEHPSFISWTEPDDEARLRAKIALTGGPGQTADLAVVFVHLPRA
jgi:hypothetical protein